LENYVERFWEIRDAPAHSRERIVPSGTIELVINLQEDEFRIYEPMSPEQCRKFSGAIVSGTYERPFLIDARQHASVIGVHFRPGGAFPFLGAWANELAGTHVNLETLWDGAANCLREQLCGARSSAERFRILEQALATQLVESMERHPSVQFALNVFARPEPGASIREVARGAGLSQRRFIQVFAREVGLAPKRFFRVRRFQKALSLARNAQAPNWADIAWECNYFDQAHLINEFRAISLMSPSEYVRQRSERVMENHVPVGGCQAGVGQFFPIQILPTVRR
jgi:AraC-like DNA-binding protein